MEMLKNQTYKLREILNLVPTEAYCFNHYTTIHKSKL